MWGGWVVSVELLRSPNSIVEVLAVKVESFHSSTNHQIKRTRGIYLTRNACHDNLGNPVPKILVPGEFNQFKHEQKWLVNSAVAELPQKFSRLVFAHTGTF